MSKTNTYRTDLQLRKNATLGVLQRGDGRYLRHGRITRGNESGDHSRSVLKWLGGITLAGLATIGIIQNRNAEAHNKYEIDIESISHLTDQERAAQYDQLTIHAGDGLESLADEYQHSHGISGDKQEIVDSLEHQATEHDIARGLEGSDHIVQPGEQFLLPKQ